MHVKFSIRCLSIALAFFVAVAAQAQEEDKAKRLVVKLERLVNQHPEMAEKLEKWLDENTPKDERKVVPVDPADASNEIVRGLQKRIDKLEADLEAVRLTIDQFRTELADIRPFGVQPHNQPNPFELDKSIIKLHINNKTGAHCDIDLSFKDAKSVTKTSRIRLPLGATIVDVHTLKGSEWLVTQLVQNPAEKPKHWRATGTPPTVKMVVLRSVSAQKPVTVKYRSP